MSHPAPHSTILLPYISSNLAQYSRTWMGLLLTSGIAPLLLPAPAEPSTRLHNMPITAIPFTLLEWDYIQNNHPGPQRKCTNNPTTKMSLCPVPISSPKHQLLEILDNQQAGSNSVSLISTQHGIGQTDLQTPTHSPTKHPSRTKLPAIIGEQKQLPRHTNQISVNESTKNSRNKIWSLHPPTQLTLFDTAVFEPSTPLKEADFWGHYPDPIDDQSTFRVFFNNPSGLKLSTDPTSTHYSFSLLEQLNTGAICLAETNVNWGKPGGRNILQNALKKVWRHSATMTSHL